MTNTTPQPSKHNIEWTYCPECGSEEHACVVRWSRENECTNCGQSWFSDSNYSEVVRKNLRRLFVESKAGDSK